MKRFTFQLVSDLHLEHYYARDLGCGASVDPTRSEDLAANAACYPEQTVKWMKRDYMDVSELRQIVETLIVPSADYLIVAGDLTDFSTMMNDPTMFSPPYANVLDVFFTHYAQHFRRIFYVLGNHEYYRTAFGLSDTLTIYRKCIACINKKIGREAVTLLENESVMLEQEDGQKMHVLGATMWSAITSAASLSMNDYQSIRNGRIAITWHDTLALHETSRSWLERTLAELGGSVPVLVITHHMPSYSLIAARYCGSSVNSAFASHLDSIVERHSCIKAWAFGHTHSSVRSPPYYCNPRGYPGEHDVENKSFDSSFHFFIGE